MTQAAKRSILRWIHIVFSIPIIGYVYSPFAHLSLQLPLGLSRFSDQEHPRQPPLPKPRP